MLQGLLQDLVFLKERGDRRDERCTQAQLMKVDEISYMCKMYEWAAHLTNVLQQD